MKKLSFFLFFHVLCIVSHAQLTITQASGGTNISADKAANATSPAFTTLGNVVLTEGNRNDFPNLLFFSATITFTAPAGWEFNPGVGSVTYNSSRDIRSASISVTATTFRITYSTASTSNYDVVTVSGLQVRATDGANNPASVSIILTSESININGTTPGTTTAGNLSQVAGAAKSFVISLPGENYVEGNSFETSGNTGTPSVVTASSAFILAKITAVDQFENIATSYSGSKTITYTGPSSAVSAPSYTTSVSFSNGRSTTTLNTTLRKAETISLSATATGITAIPSSPLTVQPGVINNMLVENSTGGNIPAQFPGVPFNIKISARDAQNNICSSGTNVFTGTANITSSGTIGAGNLTSAFTAGVCNQAIIIISTGTITITATRTGFSQAGTSNSFAVSCTPATLSTTITHNLCNGASNGSINLNVTGGSGVTGYDWTGPNGFTANTQNISSLKAGTYAVIVSLTGGCTATGSYSVTQPVALTATSVADSIIKCNGGTTTLKVNASGGTAPYTGTGTFTIAAGTSIYTITDANGCSTTTSVTIIQPSILNAVAVLDSAIKCNNGSTTLKVNATGGTAPYTGTGTYTVSAGTRLFTVTDARGCTSILSFTITQPIVLTATAVLDSSIKCNGGSTTLKVNATGGTAPYTGTGTFTVSAGTRSFTITDANGCTTITSLTITQPATLTATAILDSAIKCNGGSTTLKVNATGGTTPYSGTGTFTVSAGTRSFTITDANGCTTITSLTIIQPATLKATAIVDSAIKCNGGSTTLKINATGGTAPYTGTGTFTVSAGTRSFTITDANGCTTITSLTIIQPATLTATAIVDSAIKCNGGSTTLKVSATGGTTPYSGTGTFTVSAGTRSFTITDANGCTTITSLTIIQSATLTATAIVDSAIKCNGGSTTLKINATGGTGNLLYAINNGTFSSSNLFTNLVAGTYQFSIKDENDCMINILKTISQPVVFTSAINIITPIACFGGNATINVSGNGGTTPYTNTGNYIVPAENYTYTISDANGCASAASINIIQPEMLTMPVGFGPYDVCPYMGIDTAITYSVNRVAAAATYDWRLPQNCTLIAQSDTFIRIKFNTSFTLGYILVRSVNACGDTSHFDSIFIKRKVPIIREVIGIRDVCNFIGNNIPVTYSIAANEYATGYTWTVPAGVRIISGQGDTLIRVVYDNSFINGNVKVRASNNCSYYDVQTALINRLSPTTPVAISGPVDACPFTGTNTEVTYSIASVARATSYNWTVSSPTTMTIVSGQGDSIIKIKYSSTFTTGTIGVTSVSTCGTSAQRTLSISRRLPSTPVSVSGITNVCPVVGSSTTYKTRTAANAVNYAWTVPAGITVISQNDTTLTALITSAYTNGSIAVAAQNNCATSTARVLALSKLSAATPASITGTNNICNIQGTDSCTIYTTRRVANATSYDWTLPSGAIMTARLSDTSIRVKFTSQFVSGSTIKVRAINNCSVSTDRSYAVLSTAPAKPGVINASGPACPGTRVTYSVAEVAGASSYNWTVPANAIVTGQGTNVIQVLYPSDFVSETFTVKAINRLGTSAASSLTVTPNCSLGRIKATETMVDEETILVSTVFPNPSNGSFVVKLKTETKGEIRCMLNDMFGKTIGTYIVNSNGSAQLNINRTDLASGVYQLNFLDAGQKKSVRIMIMK